MKNKGKQLLLNDFANLDQSFRTNLINSLWGFRPTTLLGTIDNVENANLSIVNNIIHIGANPPLVGILFRPPVVERHSLENILETGYFCLNHITKSFFQKAHQTSAKYERNQSEFEATGIEYEFKPGIRVPFVKESPVKVFLQLVESKNLEVNGTVLIIGKVLEIFIDEKILGEDGFIHHDKANVVTSVGLDAYYETSLLARLQYARPDQSTKVIKY